MPVEAQLFAPQARPETTHSIPGDAGRDHRAFAGSEAWSDFGAPKRRNNRPLIHPGRCNHPNPSAITATLPTGETGQSRGFGFVTMGNVSEGNAAIKGL